MKLREKIWLWGLEPGADHFGGENALLGFNRMTPLEGAMYFGTENLIRAQRFGFPKPPFDCEAEKFDCLQNVVWFIDPHRPETVDEVIRIAKYHPNIKGAIIENDAQLEVMCATDPQVYKDVKTKLKTALGEDFELWMQLDAERIGKRTQNYIGIPDVLCTFCTYPAEIVNLEHYMNVINKFGGEGKKLVWGCCFWNFRDKQVMSPFALKDMLDKYYTWLKEGRISGIALYSNTLADIKLQAAFEAKKWMCEHGDEEI